MKDKTKPLPPTWRNAIERMDAALEKNAPPNNAELIEIFGRQHFGELWNRRPRDPDDSSNPNQTH